jgi:hypothetical protein
MALKSLWSQTISASLQWLLSSDGRLLSVATVATSSDERYDVIHPSLL